MKWNQLGGGGGGGETKPKAKTEYAVERCCAAPSAMAAPRSSCSSFVGGVK